MMFLYLFFISTFCISQILAQIVYDAEIPIGIHYEMMNPGYPDTIMGWKKPISIEWNLKVKNNGKIKVFCEDIRMSTFETSWNSDCPNTYVSIVDGKDEKKVCEYNVNNFMVLSQGPTIKLKAYGSTKGAVLFKCYAMNMGQPEDEELVYLEPMGNAKRVIINADVDAQNSNMDRIWKFESPSGTRISVQCYLILEKREPMCGKNALIFNNGKTDEEICDGTKVVWFTVANQGTLRLQLDQYGHGYVNCVAQAITGDKPNEFENLVFEKVDSSEHGVTAGSKQTSCKCGWSNKQGARVISGTETKPNEYPWMVHLFVTHDTSYGMFSGTCGASILTQRHVLTAAHCVEKDRIVAKPENVQMELAKHDKSKPTGKEVVIQAERIFVGERYLEKGLGFDDIALIFTKETIDFSTPLIGPICFEPYPLEVINKQIKIMGWGITEEKTTSKYLREGKSTVVDRAVCNTDAWDICTTSKPSGFCGGDSGGPLVSVNPNTNRYSQVSLVSRSPNCRALYLLSTNVTYYYDWIQEKIRDTDPNMKTCHEI